MTLPSQDAPSMNSKKSNEIKMLTGITASNPQCNQMAITTAKKRSRPRCRHRGSRLRSKSCGRRHRHSPTHAHKKKISAKCVPHTHAPTHHRLRGRVSPRPSFSSTRQYQQLGGKLWIRPVAVRRKSLKTAAASVAPHNYGTSFSPSSPWEEPATDSHMFDDEIVWVTSAISSFSSRPSENGRITFGESGKPILPRHAILQRTILFRL